MLSLFKCLLLVLLVVPTTQLNIQYDSNTPRVGVIGGGASGMFAATAAAEALKNPDYDVIILEGGKRTMSKVAISGGGRVSQPIRKFTEIYVHTTLLFLMFLAREDNSALTFLSPTPQQCSVSCDQFASIISH